MQPRSGGTTSQLSETEDESLLQVIGEVVLCAEEDDASLRDCRMVSEPNCSVWDREMAYW